MKSVWSGSISFGLVNIPVKLYSAITSHSTGFTLLCATCHSPISYKRWCEHCKKEVSWDNVVKGLKQPDGHYFILTKENIEKLKPEKTNYIMVNEFVDRSEIKIIYVSNHYYCVPSKKNEREFVLFQKALEDSNKVAIATFVMHEKEHITAITSYNNILLVNTLNYSYEIKDVAPLTKIESKPAISNSELNLAQELIKKLTKKKFDLSKYKDTFKERLEKALKSAKKGKYKKITKKSEPISKRPKEKSFESILRASLRKPTIKKEQPVAQAKRAKTR